MAWLVPWTSRGLLSTSSLADAVRLLRRASLSALVPGWAVGLLLVGPVCGLLLVASAARDGSVVAVTRGSGRGDGADARRRLPRRRPAGPRPPRPRGWLTTAGLVRRTAGRLLPERAPVQPQHWLGPPPRQQWPPQPPQQSQPPAGA